MPEFTAPGLGRESNHVTIDAEIGENASGVLYALGGASGGLTLYMDKGELVYEYNMMIIERYIARSKDKLAPGKHRIEVDTTIAKPGAPAACAHGRRAGRARTTVAHRACGLHGKRNVRRRSDLGSSVSLDRDAQQPGEAVRVRAAPDSPPIEGAAQADDVRIVS